MTAMFLAIIASLLLAYASADVNSFTGAVAPMNAHLRANVLSDPLSVTEEDADAEDSGAATLVASDATMSYFGKPFLP